MVNKIVFDIQDISFQINIQDQYGAIVWYGPSWTYDEYFTKELIESYANSNSDKKTERSLDDIERMQLLAARLATGRFE